MPSLLLVVVHGAREVVGLQQVQGEVTQIRDAPGETENTTTSHPLQTKPAGRQSINHILPAQLPSQLSRNINCTLQSGKLVTWFKCWLKKRIGEQKLMWCVWTQSSWMLLHCVIKTCIVVHPLGAHRTSRVCVCLGSWECIMFLVSNDLQPACSSGNTWHTGAVIITPLVSPPAWGIVHMFLSNIICYSFEIDVYRLISYNWLQQNTSYLHKLVSI
jgi:hypothetical protein